MTAGRVVNAWEAGFVEVSNGRLAYHRTGGPGLALLLSHGLTDNGLCWSRLVTALAPRFDVIMLDARGHGESSRICPLSKLDPGADIAWAAERLNLVQPIVMGHSVGARATADYANAFPNRVSKIILEDPPFPPPASPSQLAARRARFRQQVAAFSSMSDAELIAKGKAASPLWAADEFPAWVAAKRQVDPEAMPAYAEPWQDSIGSIATPTLIIHGEAERGSPVSQPIVEEARSINANISTVQIAGAGHNVRRDNFADYLKAVLAFLED